MLDVAWFDSTAPEIIRTFSMGELYTIQNILFNVFALNLLEDLY